MIPSPPVLKDIPYGVELYAGLGKSQIIGDLDFETYSEAGFIWSPSDNKFISPLGPGKEKGLSVVGTAVYAQHPSTEVICMAYDLKDGRGRRLWVPGEGLTPLADLFAYLAKGHLIEAWNCSFERWIWHYVCVPKYGFPELSFFALRDAAAKSLAFGLPPSLGPAALALNTVQKKDTEGKRLISKFSIPRNPTKTNTNKRNTAVDFPLDMLQMYAYCVQDIVTEAELSSKLPDLNAFESEFWTCDQLINWRGVQVDLKTVDKCLAIIQENKTVLEKELIEITKGTVLGASKLMDMARWLNTRGYFPDSLDVDTVAALLDNPLLPPDVKKVLKIRESLASSSVKKINTIKLQVSAQGRLHNLFVYHGARTGRASGRGVQPQNLPNSGIAVTTCQCKLTPRYVGRVCQWCIDETKPAVWSEWDANAVTHAIEDINNLDYHRLSERWGDPVALISGCIRGLLTAKEGHDLICSDYSAIEAVVLAALAGEEWRLDVFRTHGMIYEASASMITGVPFQEYIRHKKETGSHHPTRKTIGKVSELASGFSGWIGAWKNFGADNYFSDEEMKQHILAWRAASPNIVRFWGGQYQNRMPNLYGLEGCAIQAVATPGREYTYREITYVCIRDVLYCRLPSGRHIAYHRPRVRSSTRAGFYGPLVELSFEGWNTNPKSGAIGWIRMGTYGGRLTENVVQAVARDILAHAIVNLEKAGYPIVLHVHDEIVAEVPEGHGSVEEFEKIMSTMPTWAKDWPLQAKGGWRSKRYGK